MSWWKEWKPKILCLGAGGMKGLDELGAIWWFWSENVMSDLDTYIGCSIGGIICALLSIGFWPHEILEYAIDTTLFKDVSEIQMMGVTREFGLVSNSTFDDALSKRLKMMISKKMGKIPSLSEHYKITGKKLYLATASLKAREVKYVSYLTDPDMDLFVALRSTSNMPGVFGKLEHQKDYLVDGAVMDPLPALHLDDGKTPMLTIGVMDDCPWVFEKVGAVSYFDRIIAMSLKRLTEHTLANCSKACYCLIIPVSDDVGLIESSTREARMSKFLSGYRFASQYVLSNRHPLEPKITSELPPLSRDLVMACLQSNAGQTLLRCLAEDPELFKQCTGIKPRTTPRAKTPEVSSSDEEDVIEIPRQVAKLVPQHDDDEIIEIPRSEPPPDLSDFFNQLPFNRPPPLYRQPSSRGFNITINIPPEIANMLFGAFLHMSSAIMPASGGRFMLP